MNEVRKEEIISRYGSSLMRCNKRIDLDTATDYLTIRKREMRKFGGPIYI